MYPGRKDTEAPGSEGVTQGEGNQGSPTGSTESDNYAQGLGGGGINFSLAGRNPVNLPKPEYNAQVSGTVVVRIRVNREGKVISAEPGVKGSNILDENLLAAAKKAALNARFNAKSDAAYTQAGTITYHFVLQ
jgi:TonB family protein